MWCENPESLWDWDTCLKSLLFYKMTAFYSSSSVFPNIWQNTKSKPADSFHSILVLETRIIKTLEASSVSLLLLKLYKEFSIVGSEEKLNKLKF